MRIKKQTSVQKRLRTMGALLMVLALALGGLAVFRPEPSTSATAQTSNISTGTSDIGLTAPDNQAVVPGNTVLVDFSIGNYATSGSSGESIRCTPTISAPGLEIGLVWWGLESDGSFFLGNNDGVLSETEITIPASAIPNTAHTISMSVVCEGLTTGVSGVLTASTMIGVADPNFADGGVSGGNGFAGPVAIVPNYGSTAGGGHVLLMFPQRQSGQIMNVNTLMFGAVDESGDGGTDAVDITKIDNNTFQITTPAYEAGVTSIRYTWSVSWSGGGVGGMGFLPTAFTFYDTPDWNPTITLDPNEGSVAGGTEVTITSEDMYFVNCPEVSVLFGDVPATSVEKTGDQSLKVVTPPHAFGKVNVTIVCEGEGWEDRFVFEDAFTFVPGVPNTAGSARNTMAIVAVSSTVLAVILFAISSKKELVVRR